MFPAESPRVAPAYSRPKLLPPGYILADRYWIRSLVGGMTKGAVYLATEAGRSAETRGRTVLIRLYDDPWEPGAESLLRAVHLAKESSAISHPNLARLIDLGTCGGQAYCVMDWIANGILLDEYVRSRGGLPVPQFAPIAGQILNAVGHAHARSKFFGDLDGSSIILGQQNDRDNHVVITALGLTQDVTSGSRDGTPYCPPERVSPTEMFNLRRDVYSVGILLWFMLSGSFPPHDTGRSLSDSWEGEELPPGLIELIEECVAIDPASRPADVNVVLRRLSELIPAEMFRLPAPPQQATSNLAAPPVGTAIDLPSIDRLRDLVGGERDAPEAAAPAAFSEHERRRWLPIGLGAVGIASALALALAWTPWSVAGPTPLRPELESSGSRHLSQAASVESTRSAEPVDEVSRATVVRPPAQTGAAKLRDGPDASEDPAQAVTKVEAAKRPKPKRRTRPRQRVPVPKVERPSPSDTSKDAAPEPVADPDTVTPSVSKLDDELRAFSPPE